MANSGEGEKTVINSELWHACAGPLVSLPPVGSLVVYFPQGHSEQVAASMQKETDGVPSYPNLPSKMICMLRNVTLHADSETDEVYAQMTLQPVSKCDQEALLLSDIGIKQSRQPTEFFCKTLTASDTSTHGGFSVPRRAAEKIFPPLDFSMQPPAQELTARDLHDHNWSFRHIYRGQPKRHLLTTGWSVFVSSKRLVAGDAVLFIRDEKSQLLVGMRRVIRQQPALSSSVISSDSMHIGILAAADHAASNSSSFAIFYNPRASPSEFVVPLAKYNKAMYTQVAIGMRFRMMFETEDSGVRRYVGTITGISDLDSVRWKNSQWRNIQVGWDESTAGDRPTRVSIWDIEPVATPFYMCPPLFFRPNFAKHPGVPGGADLDNIFKQGMPWISDEFGLKDPSSSIFPGLSLAQWMSMQQSHQLSANPSGLFPGMVPPTSLPGNLSTDDPSKLLNFRSPALAAQNLQFSQGYHQIPQVSSIQQSAVSWPQQQTSPSPITIQQPQQQQQQHPQLPMQQPQPHILQQAPPQQCFPQQPHLQQQSIISPPVTNSIASDQSGNPISQQPAIFADVRLQRMLTGDNTLVQQNDISTNRRLVPGMFSTQPTEQQMNLSRRPRQQQMPLQQASTDAMAQVQQAVSLLPNLSEQQLQLLQKLQQQKQLAAMAPLPESQSMPLQQLNGGCYPASTLGQSPQFPVNQLHSQQRNSLVECAPSLRSDGDVPSCSTSASENFLRNQTRPVALHDNSIAHHSSSIVQDTNGKIDVQTEVELPNSKAPDHQRCKGSAADHMDASSSATSYSFDAGGLQQNLHVDASDDVQSNTRGSTPFTAAIDRLTPETMLLTGSDSGKGMQNLLSNYNDTPMHIETELSSGINSQSFGMLPMFKPGYLNDTSINDMGALNGGSWPNQAQRMRTYTKVQKRGSVGRTIDVTRYEGYDELRNDLARMFGIEGLLEDPQRNEWKFVYVDHENDILLVGDDPWEEFVSCVQSIKILSSAEVQKMSLNGDLGQVPAPNQVCSGTNSDNAWRRQYDNNSASSFNQ